MNISVINGGGLITTWAGKMRLLHTGLVYVANIYLILAGIAWVMRTLYHSKQVPEYVKQKNARHGRLWLGAVAAIGTGLAVPYDPYYSWYWNVAGLSGYMLVTGALGWHVGNVVGYRIREITRYVGMALLLSVLMVGAKLSIEEVSRRAKVSKYP